MKIKTAFGDILQSLEHPKASPKERTVVPALQASSHTTSVAYNNLCHASRMQAAS